MIDNPISIPQIMLIFIQCFFKMRVHFLTSMKVISSIFMTSNNMTLNLLVHRMYRSSTGRFRALNNLSWSLVMTVKACRRTTTKKNILIEMSSFIKLACVKHIWISQSVVQVSSAFNPATSHWTHIHSCNEDQSPPPLQSDEGSSAVVYQVPLLSQSVPFELYFKVTWALLQHYCLLLGAII